MSQYVSSRDEEIDRTAQSMHVHLISKGRKEMTNIIKACLDDNSQDNSSKKRKTIDAIDYSKKGNHLIDI